MPNLRKLQQIDAIKSQLSVFSLKLDELPRFGAFTNLRTAEVYAVYPDTDKLGHINADQELVVGTLDDIEVWIRGVQWCEQNFYNLGLTTREKKLAAEVRERDKYMLNLIRTGRK